MKSAVLSLPEAPSSRLSALDEAGLRTRLACTAAKAELYADSLRQWSVALVDVSHLLGVDVDGSTPDEIVSRCATAIRELRTKQLVLETMTRWRL